MLLNAISLGILIGCVILIVVGVWKIHTLPGQIAKKRHHPQSQAIEVTAYLGLIAFPLWMAALIWAYLKPVFRPIELAETRPAAIEPAESAETDAKED